MAVDKNHRLFTRNNNNNNSVIPRKERKKKKYKENIEKFDFFWVASLYYISFKISETDGLLNNLAQVRTGISQYQSDILIYFSAFFSRIYLDIMTIPHPDTHLILSMDETLRQPLTDLL